jgi:uncharacterized LabA/DUF88 family protein
MLTPRSILFVDGENLVMRYQDMLAAGKHPDERVVHIQDVFVWHSGLMRWHDLNSVIRVVYYTSVVGDDQRVAGIRKAIAAQTFTSSTDNGAVNGQLVPIVFKKPSRSLKTRNVDIQIIIDVMRYAFTDEIDRVYIASGDGDYLPLLTEVMRRGKQVEVLAFSSGLNEVLQYSVDRFTLLDTPFFNAT